MRKRWIALVCMLCVILSVVTAGAEDVAGNNVNSLKASLQSNRSPLLVLTPGTDEGEVGYGGSEQFGYVGPDSFVVEDV